MKTYKQNPLKRVRRFLAALSLSLAALGAQAATLWYDGGTTGIATPGDGASAGLAGNWNTNTALTNWDVGDGLDHVAWNNTANAGDTAVFGNLGNIAAAVTVGPVSVGGLVFSSTGGGSTTRWPINTGPITLGSGTIIDGSAMDSTREASISLNAVLTGDVGSGVTLIGGSTINAVAYENNFNSLTTSPRINCLSLAGSNSFTGPVTISNVVEVGGATVALGRFPSLGGSSKNVTLSQGTLLPFNAGTFAFDHNLIVDGINNAVSTHNATVTYTLSGNLSSKNGSGDVFWSVARTTNSKLIYTGNLAGFAGTFYVRGGTTGVTIIDNADSFGGTFYVDSGNLQIGNADAKGSLGNNDIVNNGTINYNRTNNLTYGGNFSGTGALKVNSGTLLLNGVNTHAGATTVTNNATLAGSGSLSGPVTLLPGGTLGAGTASLGTLNLTGNLTLNAGSTNLMRIHKSGATLSSDRITGLPGLVYAGTLTVTATGDALNDGDTFTLFTLASGTYGGGFAVLNLPTLPAGKSWDTSQLLVNGSIQVAGGAAPPAFSPPAGKYAGAQTVTISSASPGATIYYTTDGSTPTAGSPSGPSPVQVNVPTDATTTVKAYAAAVGFSDSGVVSATYFTLSYPIWLNADGGSWAVATNWLSEVIATGVGITADFSTLGLAGDTTVTLDSTPTVGALHFADTSSVGNWVLNSGTGGPLTLNAGANVPVIAVSNQTATISAVLAGTNGFAKAGAGQLDLLTGSTFAGNVAVNEGTLYSAGGAWLGASALGNSNTVTVASGVTLKIGGTLGTSSMGVSPNNTLVLNGGTLTYSISGASPPDSCLLGVVTLNGATVNTDNSTGTRAGRSRVSSINAITAPSVWSAPIWLQNTGVGSLVVNADTNLTIDSAILDYPAFSGVPVIKTGVGRLTLAGGNSYAGTTTVSNGVLEVAVGSSTGIGNVNVENNGVLSVSGTVGSTSPSVTTTAVKAGGTLSVGGASIASVSISGNLILNAGATNVMKADKTGGVITADQIAGLNALTFGGTLKVVATGQTFTLGDAIYLYSAGGYIGTFSAYELPSLPAGLNWDKSQLAPGGSGALTVVAQASTPVLTPPAGNYVGSVNVTITSDAGSTIFYSTDGNDPTSSSPNGPSPLIVNIPVDASLTLKAYATNSGVANSGVASATYFTQSQAVWTSAFDGSWTDGWNWLNGVIPNGSGILANFNTLTLTTDTTVSLNGPQTVGYLVFGDVGNAFSWIVTNGTGGSLTLDAGTNLATISVVNTNTTMAATLVSTNGLAKTGAGTLRLTGNASGVANLTISNGTTVFLTGFDLKRGMASSGTLTVMAGGVARLGDGTTNAGVNNFSSSGQFNILGGTLDVVDRTDIGKITLTGGQITGSSGTGNPGRLYAWSGVSSLASSTTAIIANGNLSIRATNNFFDVASGTAPSGIDLEVAAAILGASNQILIKTGPGTLLLTATNSALAGTTTVSNGTLLVNGSLGTSPVTVEPGATFGGTGVIGGAVNVAGTLVPGSNGIGTLTINNTLTLNGASTTTVAIDRSAGPSIYGRVAGLTSATFGGTLTVTSLGGVFQAGDSFQLFNVGSGSNFTTTNLPPLASGLGWNWNPTTGVMSVVSTTGPSGPATIVSSVTGGNTLNLTWPAGEGWRLVGQTNNLATGLDPNPAAWGTVSGVSDGNASLTIDPTKPTVFYRLVYP